MVANHAVADERAFQTLLGPDATPIHGFPGYAEAKIVPKIGVGLHEAVVRQLALSSRGRVLDVGTGSGELARRLVGLGFEVAACDGSPASHWNPGDGVAYRECDLNAGLPYDDESFDYIVCLEVIEHLDNPFALCRELRRVLRKDGNIYISTPNILNMRSRMKFLLDGSFLYFDLPPLEWGLSKGRPNVHVHPIRYHELEYFLFQAGLQVNEVFTNERSTSWKLAFPLTWLIRSYALHMIRRSRKQDRICLQRIYDRILSDDLLYGSHVIVRAVPL